MVGNANEKEAGLEKEDFLFRDHSAGATSPKPHSSYLGFDPYAELPLDKKPADIVLDSLRNIPVGTPVEEIKRAADAFGLDSSFMEAVAKIESDFDPTQRTGSYIGLFQLSRSEFRKYGSGDITSPRDDAVAAAYKLVTEATLCELYTHRESRLSANLYLILSSTRMARRSGNMSAIQSGLLGEINVRYRRRPTKRKGERWCKRAQSGGTRFRPSNMFGDQ